MPKRLHTYCCRLCLHDGSVHELLDILSTEGLGQKILNIFNIKITHQDNCTTNICLPCFSEALTIDRQMQLFKKQKQTILNNQERLKKSTASATAVSKSSTAPAKVQVVAASSKANVTQTQQVGVSTNSTPTRKTTAHNIRHEGSKRASATPAGEMSRASEKVQVVAASSKTNVTQNQQVGVSTNLTPMRKTTADNTRDESSKRASAPAVGELSTASEQVQVVPTSVTQNQSVGVSTNSTPTRKTTADNIRNDSSKRLNSSQNITSIVELDKTNDQKNNAKKVKDTKNHTLSSTKESSGKQETPVETLKSCSKRPGSTSTVKTVQFSVERIHKPTKPTGNNLPNPAISNHSHVQHPANNEKASNLAKTIATAAKSVETKKAVNPGAKRLSVSFNLGDNAKNVVLPATNNADKTNTIVNNENRKATNDPNTVGSSKQSNLVHMPGSQQAVEKVVNNELQLERVEKDTPDQVSTVSNIPSNRPITVEPPLTTEKDMQAQVSTVTNNFSNRPITVQSESGVPATQKAAGSVPSLGDKFKPTFTPLQGGLCSIPLANISTAAYLNESRAAASSASNVTVTGTSSLATDRLQPTATSALDNACTPVSGSQFTSVGSNVREAPVGNRDDSTINNVVHPGAIKKRRHSTYIRVSTNLFDEPPEKAQFAMLHNNCFVRNDQPQPSNVPPVASSSILPVLPPGMRVQIVSNHQTSMPFNSALNSNVLNAQQDTSSTYATQPLTTSSAINEMSNVQHAYAISSQVAPGTTQAITNSSNFGSNVGNILIQRTVTTSTNASQQQSAGFTTIPKLHFLNTNSTINNNITALPNNSFLNAYINTTLGSRANATNPTTNIPANNNPTTNNATTSNTMNHQVRPCYRCNLCFTYYLLIPNLVTHMRKYHQVERDDQNCSTLYDNKIVEKMLSRYRRKSIADPSLLSRNLT